MCPSKTPRASDSLRTQDSACLRAHRRRCSFSTLCATFECVHSSWALVKETSRPRHFEDPVNSRRARDLRNNLVKQQQQQQAPSFVASTPLLPYTHLCVCISRHHVQPCPRPAAGQRPPSCRMSHYLSAGFKKPLTPSASQLGARVDTK
jgi:hypothetical protein